MPSSVLAVWLREYEAQARWNQGARGQLVELISALGAAGVDAIVLKGGASILMLYEDAGCRELRDLDLLIPPSCLSTAAACLKELGYERRPEGNAQEFDGVRIQAGDGVAFMRAGSRMVELHSDLGGPVATTEAWAEATTVEYAGAAVKVLCSSHFLIHTALHYMKHLDLSFAPLKGLVDMDFAIRKHADQIDWPHFWSTAERWRALDRVALVMATLNHHWNLNIPGGPEGARPLSVEVLVYGVPDIEAKRAAHVPVVYLSRLQQLRSLSVGAGIRYLFRLLVPEPQNLRYRYGIPEGEPLGFAYVRHPFVLARRLLTGLAALARRGPRR